MARKPALNLDVLNELGIEKLSQLVIDEAGRNVPFRRLVLAAVAGVKGPEAVVKLIDKRLLSIERSKSFIDWDKERAFQQDLLTIVDAIASELSPKSPEFAVDRLLRFVATHVSVFQRIDDSHGRIQDVYHQAISHIGKLSAKLPVEGAAALPERIMSALGYSSHGYLIEVAEAVAPHLFDQVLRGWDTLLASNMKSGARTDAGEENDNWLISQFRTIRQIIASRLGDIDGFVALEEQKHPNLQDTVGIASKLLEASRAAEALAWVRKKRSGGLRYMSAEDFADGPTPRDAMEVGRASLEAKILTALGEKKSAQELRWKTFTSALEPSILKEYIVALGDFEEFEALDQAFAHVMRSSDRYRALEFMMEWPRLDLAANLVILHRKDWDGGLYYLLPDFAADLEHDHPLAATILYRVLLDDILARGRSKAYGHGSRYLSNLYQIAKRLNVDMFEKVGLIDHEAYHLALRKTHGRKSGFWSLIAK